MFLSTSTYMSLNTYPNIFSFKQVSTYHSRSMSSEPTWKQSIRSRLEFVMMSQDHITKQNYLFKLTAYTKWTIKKAKNRYIDIDIGIMITHIYRKIEKEKKWVRAWLVWINSGGVSCCGRWKGLCLEGDHIRKEDTGCEEESC